MSTLRVYLVGFVLFHALAAVSARADIDCGNDLWTGGFPGRLDRHAPLPCSEISGELGLPSNLKLYVDREVPAVPAVAEISQVVGNALRDADAAYRTLGHMPPVTAVIYHLPYEGSAAVHTLYAAAFFDFYEENESCPIVIFPPSLAFTRDYLKQMVAHEMFHCFQRENFHEQLRHAARRPGPGLWWMEGLAQFMSNWVFPREDMEYGTFLRPYAPGTPLTTQPAGYGTVHFFQSWYNQAHTITPLVSFIGAMATADGQSEEQALVAGGVTPEIFQEFAKSYLDGSFRDSNGRNPELPEVERVALTVTDEPEQSLRFSILPISLKSFRVTLPERSRVRITADGLSDRARASWREVGSRDWHELRGEIHSNCSEPKEIEIVVTAVTGSLDELSGAFTVAREDDESCGCEVTHRPTDRCLVGTWSLDYSTMPPFYDRLTNGMSTLIEASGSTLVTYSGDGTITTVKNNDLLKSRSDRGRVSVLMTQISNGTGTAQYSTLARGKVCLRDTELGFRTHVIMVLNGQTREYDQPPASPSGNTAMFTYQCSGDTMTVLEYLGIGPGGSSIVGNLVYRRVRP